MDTIWGTFLFLGKWVLIGLVYLLLFLLLRAVRNEMRPGVVVGSPAAAVAGSLRVTEPGAARLQPGQILPLPNEVVLGSRRERLSRHDIVLRDNFVSGRHARLEWDGVSWWVEDLESTNGTYVGGRRLASGERVSLPAGSQLQVGGVIFELLA